MAEAFGVGAGVLTVIDLTAKVISRCKHLIETAHDAPKDLRHIFVEISSLKSVLESFQFLFDSQSGFSDVVRKLGSVDGTVQGCRTTVEDLARELDGISLSQGSQTTATKRQTLKGSLKWCLKQSKARKLLAELAQHKATITLTLLGDITQDVKYIKSTVSTIHDSFSEAEKREISDWIEGINPTSNHQAVRRLHEDNTCHWISRIDQWTQWLSCRQRLVWIHGIPGAGKTVLASYLIEQTNKYCKDLQSTNGTCLYYYCSYRHGQDEAKPLLRWIVSQLCRQFGQVPLSVATSYRSNHELSSNELKDALKGLLSGFDVLYLIVDAADESIPREHFLGLLKELVFNPDFGNIQLLVTSRNYPDIHDVLGSLVEAAVPMSNPVVDADIRTYVDAVLQNDRRFSRWPKDLSAEVLESLVKGAKGMFRWAVCQLDILHRKRSLQEIRTAIKQLPRTLDETYERILLEIPQDDWPFARTALLWICAHDDLPFKHGMPSNCLLSAMFQNEQNDRSQDHTIFFGEEPLQDILGCLISVLTPNVEGANFASPDFESLDPCPLDSESGITYSTVSLAHYTVREYVYSTRIAMSAVSYFALSQNICAREVLQLALRPPAQVSEDFLMIPYHEKFERYCYEVARVALTVWESVIIQDDEILRLLQNICSEPLFFKLHDRTTVKGRLRDGAHEFDLSIVFRKPLGEFSQNAQYVLALSIRGCWKMAAKALEHFNIHSLLSASIGIEEYGWNDGGWPFPSTFQNDTILHVLGVTCGFFGSEPFEGFLKLLWKHISGTDALVFLLAAHYHNYTCGDGRPPACIISKALKTGADVNAPELAFTPLQIAVHRWDLAGTQLLLEAGADPNRIGSPSGCNPAQIDTTWASSSPLHILRNAEYGFMANEGFTGLHERRKRKRPEIEQLLISYGAQDF